MKKNYLILVCFLTLTSCKQNDLNIKFVDINEFNINDKVNVCNLIKANEKIKIENNYLLYKNDQYKCDNIDTSKVGENYYKLQIGDREFEYKYSIVDKEIPIIDAQDEYYIDPNQEFKITDYISVYDNDDATVSLVGAINSEVEGKYQLKIKAQDKANNESEKYIWVQVGKGDEIFKLQDEEKKTQTTNSTKFDNEAKNKEPNVKYEAISNEEILSKIEVLDPDCKFGEYLIEATNALSAAEQGISQYGCWQVEANKENENLYKISCICTKNNKLKKDSIN